MPELVKESELSEDEKMVLEGLSPKAVQDWENYDIGRRRFFKQSSLAAGALMASQLIDTETIASSVANEPGLPPMSFENSITLSFKVNGVSKAIVLDSRTSLLDTLRERLNMMGTKKGCDHGQCGACTVLVDGRRVLSCLTLGASCEGKSVTTIEGLAKGDMLHPLQTAFIKHDGFQCGYCTPGQICSAVALLNEAKNGQLSYVTENIRQQPSPVILSEEEIRERMSGNICRCGAYVNIVNAIREVQTGKNDTQDWQFASDNSQPLFITGE